MHRSEQSPSTVSPTQRTRSRTDVEQRRSVIVALLHQHQNGLTTREIREAIGLSRSLTDSALSGLFTRGVVHKRRICPLPLYDSAQIQENPDICGGWFFIVMLNCRLTNAFRGTTRLSLHQSYSPIDRNGDQAGELVKHEITPSSQREFFCCINMSRSRHNTV